MAAVHETIRVKSAAWDDAGVLVYTTLNHIKYCLPNGDAGIIRTLDTPVYITRVAGGTIHALDRDGKVRQIEVRGLSFFLAPATLPHPCGGVHLDSGCVEQRRCLSTCAWACLLGGFDMLHVNVCSVLLPGMRLAPDMRACFSGALPVHGARLSCMLLPQGMRVRHAMLQSWCV